MCSQPTVRPVRALIYPALLTLSLSAACASPSATVYLVRHAEKAPDPGDGNPELSEAGHARAKALARTLADVPLQAVITTELVRTQQTAAPTVRAHQLTPEVITSADIAGLAQRLKAVPPGQRVLVVGHSHTIPELMRRLGHSDVKVDSGDYDDVWVLTVGGSTVRSDRLHIGPPGRQD